MLLNKLISLYKLTNILFNFIKELLNLFINIYSYYFKKLINKFIKYNTVTQYLFFKY